MSLDLPKDHARRIADEGDAVGRVESVDGLDEPDSPRLYEVFLRFAAVAVTLRQRVDEPEMTLRDIGTEPFPPWVLISSGSRPSGRLVVG
jgi:hypothetical protein